MPLIHSGGGDFLGASDSYRAKRMQMFSAFCFMMLLSCHERYLSNGTRTSFTFLHLMTTFYCPVPSSKSIDIFTKQRSQKGGKVSQLNIQVAVKLSRKQIRFRSGLLNSFKMFFFVESYLRGWAILFCPQNYTSSAVVKASATHHMYRLCSFKTACSGGTVQELGHLIDWAASFS